MEEGNKNGKKFRGQRWALTVHGQTKEDFEKLVKFFDTDEVRCACISKEFGEHKIHPHWQVYFELEQRVQNARTMMIDVLAHEDFHIEKALGTKEANVSYVYGVNKHYEVGFVEYTKNVSVPIRYNPKAAEFWKNFVPRPFQKQIIEIAKNPDWEDRLIYWFYEPNGNTGKTKLAEYLHIYHGAIITGGKAEDMKHAVSRWQQIVGQSPTIIIVDMARSDSFNESSAKGIESIKNGLFFDGKYESAMLHAIEKPHVFVFSNQSPKIFEKYFSKDRWKIYEIVNLHLEKRDF
jgi:hypothetical protein